MASEWISVEERLPPIGKLVLFVAPGRGVFTGSTAIVKNNRNEKTSTYGWHMAGCSMIAARDVTHWMPLPEPPQTGGSK